MSEEKKVLGKVKWFNAKKGYGFLTSESFPSCDVFVHFQQLNMEGFKVLKENQEVHFESSFVDGRYRALNVDIIS